jgi:hypothetical protein
MPGLRCFSLTEGRLQGHLGGRCCARRWTAGRIDLVAEYRNERVAIEIDYRSPREKSLDKLRQFRGYRIVCLRGAYVNPPDGIDAVVALPMRAGWQPHRQRPLKELDPAAGVVGLGHGLSQAPCRRRLNSVSGLKIAPWLYRRTGGAR